MGSGSIYRSDAARAAIDELYDRARERLPFVTESRMVPTRFGETHVLVAGPLDGTPVVALQGGNVVNPLTLAWLTPLVESCRIYAPDTIGQPGKTVGGRVSANDSSLGDWTTDVLDGLGLPSASFIGASYGAGVLLRLASRGIRVPEDLSVVGFDNIFGSDWCDPPLTTLSDRTDQAGRSAIDLLVSLIEDEGEDAEPPAQIVAPTELVVRRPTGRARVGSLESG